MAGAQLGFALSAKEIKDMIYFLYGPDSYRSKQELTKLLIGLKEKNPTAQVVEFDFDLEDYSYGQFQECYSSNSLFASTKIVRVLDFLVAEIWSFETRFWKIRRL